MDPQISSEGDAEGDTPGLGEQILLGAVKLASLPFFLLAIVLMSSIYGVAFLARCVGMLAAAGARGRGRPVRSLGHPARPQDA